MSHANQQLKVATNNHRFSYYTGNGGGGVDIDLDIDQTTGEIRTAVPLDREERSYYSFIALPLSGAVIKVTIVCIHSYNYISL